MSDDVDEIAKVWGIGEAGTKTSATIHELKPPTKEPPIGKPPYAAFINKDKVYAFTIVSQSPRLEYSFFYQNLLQLVVNAPPTVPRARRIRQRPQPSRKATKNPPSTERAWSTTSPSGCRCRARR